MKNNDKHHDKHSEKYYEKHGEKRDWQSDLDRQERKEEKKKRREEYGYIDHSDEIKRLNRIVGQIEGVRKMLDEQRKLDDVLMQCKAVHSALKSIETRILRAHLESALDEIARLDKRKTRAEKLEGVEALFKHVKD